MERGRWHVTGATILVVAIALFFATSMDPYSLMVLATASYLAVLMASAAATAHGADHRAPRHGPHVSDAPPRTPGTAQDDASASAAGQPSGVGPPST